MKITERILPAGWIGLTLEDIAEIHDNLREPVNSSERAKRPGSYPYYGATGQVGWIDDFRQDGEYVLLAKMVRLSLNRPKKKPTWYQGSAG